ncbi:MAG: lipoyl(octanoyl) transferase LipB [Methanobacteriota archaeon]|nr:MAG: lipoyl(octanoyl) transferase LipB [Euryarchaeota archaeon]
MNLGRQPYTPVWEFQRMLQRARIEERIPDVLIYVEHDPVYTIGKNGSDLNIIASESFLKQHGIEVVHVDRGGDVTYHGPGQLVGYPIFHLKYHRKSVSWYMRQLEEVFIRVLANWGLKGYREEGLTGVWVEDEKIVAFGVRISRWVTMHGFAFNINTRLNDFDGIIPCGILHKGVTSLEKILGRRVEWQEVLPLVTSAFKEVFSFQTVLEVHPHWNAQQLRNMQIEDVLEEIRQPLGLE